MVADRCERLMIGYLANLPRNNSVIPTLRGAKLGGAVEMLRQNRKDLAVATPYGRLDRGRVRGSFAEQPAP